MAHTLAVTMCKQQKPTTICRQSEFERSLLQILFLACWEKLLTNSVAVPSKLSVIEHMVLLIVNAAVVYASMMWRQGERLVAAAGIFQMPGFGICW